MPGEGLERWILAKGFRHFPEGVREPLKDLKHRNNQVTSALKEEPSGVSTFAYF